MAGSSTEYIKHHLTNLTFGNHPEQGWSFARNAQDVQDMGFWAFHVDSLGWSITLGLVFVCCFVQWLKMQRVMCQVVCKILLKSLSTSLM